MDEQANKSFIEMRFGRRRVSFVSRSPTSGQFEVMYNYGHSKFYFMNNVVLWSTGRQTVGKSTNNITNPRAAIGFYNPSGERIGSVMDFKSDRWQFKTPTHPLVELTSGSRERHSHTVY